MKGASTKHRKIVNARYLGVTNCYFKIHVAQYGANSSCLSTSPLQEFFLADEKKWVPAYSLKKGIGFFDAQQNEVNIASTEFIKKRLELYSIEVEDTHNFFVGPHAVLTHNLALSALSLGFSIPFGAGHRWGLKPV